ncbi:hypothetical protein [Granulicella mallensis]|uniref:Uncharacterized protein n=1 Tax=Granulicella mallensis TaxID=940614 RepID=A0A7W7ZQJ0_9BACT|nr:hypothetical protein [Granulicella mallensis]MBB5063912.1 hypothetical protein [Granulicella mallensis]
MIRPWLILARRRLIVALLGAMGLVLIVHFWVSAENFTDIGIFWHHFCGCPVDPNDVSILLNTFFAPAVLIGIVLGLNFGVAYSQTNAFAGHTRFLLTRPILRAAALLVPLAVASVAIAVIPLLAVLLLLGWLRLVHAPSLGHLLATIQQMPAVAALGPHPTFFGLLGAIDFPRRYLAGISIGLCFYAVMASQRWLFISSNKKLRILGAIPPALVYFPAFSFFKQHYLATIIFLSVNRSAALTYVPSTLGIALHFVFAAAIVFGCWRILHTVEL